MILVPKKVSRAVLRLSAFLALLGWPGIGSAAGTWSVISLPQKPGDVISPTALAVGTTGDLSVADQSNGGQIQKRDAQGNWSVIATEGDGPGRVDLTYGGALAIDAAGNLYAADSDRIQKRDAQGNWSLIGAQRASALAVDTAGNLYVSGSGIQKRDAQGNWSVIATTGNAVGQVYYLSALAVDTLGNLYVADGTYVGRGFRIQKRDPQGNWSVIADSRQVAEPSSLAVDTAGNLYVAEENTLSLDPRLPGRVQQRDAQGHWSVITDQVFRYLNLAADTAGNLYVSDSDWSSRGRIQKRDAQGNWSLIATEGKAPGQVAGPTGVVVDRAGDLYVAGHGWIQKRDAQGTWSIITTDGTERGEDVGAVFHPTALATDATGNLYVSEASIFASGGSRIQELDAQGHWSVIAIGGSDPGQVISPSGLAVDALGSLYVADLTNNGRIQKRDAQGNWFVIAAHGSAAGQVDQPSVLAVDTSGNLYVAEPSRIQKRDAQGNWSVVAPYGQVLDQVYLPSALAVDAGGNLYVADVGIDDGQGAVGRIQERDAQGRWSVIATRGIAPGQVDLSYDGGLAVDTEGNLYVADTGNHRIQVYTP